MTNGAVFTTYNGHYVLMHIINDKAMHIYAYGSLEGGNIGRIINCRVEKGTGIDASFVRYSAKESGFINRDLKNGSRVALMYKKDPTAGKRACFTDKISITGKYAVVIDDDPFVKCSSKAVNSKKNEYIDHFNETAHRLHTGLIIRTQAFNEDDGMAKADEEISRIHALINAVKEKSAHTPDYTVLYCPLPDFINDIRYLIDQGIEEIVTDDESIMSVLKKTYEDAGGPVNVTDRVGLRFYDDKLLSVTALYAFGAKISEALSRKVYLKSGGYITIDTTEALTAVDVNTASLKPSGSASDNFRKINTEAADEIARQIVLRNLSGIIIIDFINMKSDMDYADLKSRLELLFKKDRISCRFVDFTKLGLCEVTRKREGVRLSEIFYD